MLGENFFESRQVGTTPKPPFKKLMAIIHLILAEFRSGSSYPVYWTVWTIWTVQMRTR